MFKIDITSQNLDAIKKQLDELRGDKQAETLRKALNDTTRALHEHMTKQIPTYVDRPKAVTLRSLYPSFASAKRKDLEAGIEFRSWIGKKILSRHWLAAMVFGGARRDKGFDKVLRMYNILPAGFMAVPTEAVRTDGHGNAPGTLVVQIISWLRIDPTGTQNRTGLRYGEMDARQRRRYRSANRFFVVRVGERSNLKPGIYRYKVANGTRTQPERVYEFLRVSYRSTFPFFDIAQRFATPFLMSSIRERVAAALAKQKK